MASEPYPRDHTSVPGCRRRSPQGVHGVPGETEPDKGGGTASEAYIQRHPNDEGGSKDQPGWRVLHHKRRAWRPLGGVLRSTEEADKLAAEDGEDEVYALGGGDKVEGGACDDEVYGGPGDDVILGGDGSEVIYGGPGKDNMVGKEGDDIIYGGAGDDKQVEGRLGRGCPLRLAWQRYIVRS